MHIYFNNLHHVYLSLAEYPDRVLETKGAQPSTVYKRDVSVDKY